MSVMCVPDLHPESHYVESLTHVVHCCAFSNVGNE